MAIKIDSKKLKELYLEFFKQKGHKVIPNAPLVPEEDPTVLFTTAGMHPLVPFLLGQSHPMGKRLTNVQKCLRTDDIDEVGDEFHLTFFEMLGNWSLGDYFKKEAIEFSFEFLTDKKWLGLDKKRLCITVFAGDKDAQKDDESAKVWQSLGIPKERIFYMPKKDNWWGPAGQTGPCGPDTEMFYDTGEDPCEKDCKPGCGCGKYFEIWNDVFMQYNKTAEGKYELLKQKNVDTGMGVERTVAVLQNKPSVFEIETFFPIIQKIEKLSGKKYGKDKGETRAMRIIADHVKASVFIIADGVVPSNVERGYVLRRLMRRAIRYAKELGINENITKIAEPVFEIYDEYDHVQKNKSKILDEMQKEENKFKKTLEEGLRKAKNIFEKKVPLERKKFIQLMQTDKREILYETFRKKKEGKPYAIKELKIFEKEIDDATVNSDEAFLLFQSFGFPLKMILELAREGGLLLDGEEFKQKFEKHQQLSRVGAGKKFKGGLSEASEETTKLHTATHMLNEALRRVLKKKDIVQKGSNITPERLRFDFNFDRKLTDEELKAVEDIVNEQIKKGLAVKRKEMTLEQAKKIGAQAMFEHKYGDVVSVYSIGDFSVEICGGPHVKNIKELGKFKIIKEESVAAGVRRIKAKLE